MKKLIALLLIATALPFYGCSTPGILGFNRQNRTPSEKSRILTETDIEKTAPEGVPLVTLPF